MTEDNVTLPLTTTSLYFLRITVPMIVAIGLIANGVLLYVTIKHNALQVNATSKMFIVNIASSDMMILLITYLPMCLTAFCGRWVLGKRACYVLGILNRAPIVYECMCTAIFSCYRLLLVRKRSNRSIAIPTHRRVFVNVVLLFLMTLFLIFSLRQGRQVRFAPRILTCFQNITQSISARIVIIASIFGILIIFIFVTNLLLVKEVCCRRNVAQTTKQTLYVLIFVNTTFLLSYLPLSLYAVLKMRHKIPDYFPAYIPVICASVNSFINPFFYYCINSSFQSFINTAFLGQMNIFRRTMQKMAISITWHSNIENSGENSVVVNRNISSQSEDGTL